MIKQVNAWLLTVNSVIELLTCEVLIRYFVDPGRELVKSVKYYFFLNMCSGVNQPASSRSKKDSQAICRPREGVL